MARLMANQGTTVRFSMTPFKFVVRFELKFNFSYILTLQIDKMRNLTRSLRSFCENVLYICNSM